MRIPSPMAVAGILLFAGGFPSEGIADSIPLKDWFAISSTPNADIIAGDTASPEYLGVDHRSPGVIFSYFDPVTLADGQKLTLHFDLTLDIDASEIRFPELRIGLFKSSLPKADATFDKRVGRHPSVTERWTGFLVMLPNDPASAKFPVIYRRAVNDESGYALKSGLDLRNTFIQPAPVPVFENGKSKAFSLELERNGEDLTVTLVYDEESFYGILPAAFGGDYESVFDALGFYATGEDAIVQNVRFTDARLESAQEPQP